MYEIKKNLKICEILCDIESHKSLRKQVSQDKNYSASRFRIFHSPIPLRCCFSVCQFCSKVPALPGFGYFSVEHARKFIDNAKNVLTNQVDP